MAARVDMMQATSNVLGYTAMLAAYRDGGAWHEALLRYLEANRDFLAGYLTRHLAPITMSPVEGTYLAWLDCRATGIPDPFTFGTPRALVTEGLERMRKALAAR